MTRNIVRRQRPSTISKNCGECGAAFLAKNRTARFCGAICREVYHRQSQRDAYHRDPKADVHDQLVKRRRTANARWEVIFSVFGNKCSRCQGTFPRQVYDLHHVAGRKSSAKDTPSRVIRMGSQTDFNRLLMETELLCANCHRIEHMVPEVVSDRLTWTDRIENYCEETGYPKALFLGADGRVVGTWIMGNSYRVRTGYYGGYPDTYLKRIKALFPDKTKPLHIFSGRVDLSALPGDTVDINPSLEPTFVDDAQTLEGVPLGNYDLILADPPYSVEDAEHYQTTMVKRNKVMSALSRCAPGTHVVWLDQVLPMYRKDTWAIDAVIGMVKSTNHRFRVVTVFRRLSGGTLNPKGGDSDV